MGPRLLDLVLKGGWCLDPVSERKGFRSFLLAGTVLGQRKAVFAVDAAAGTTFVVVDAVATTATTTTPLMSPLQMKLLFRLGDLLSPSLGGGRGSLIRPVPLNTGLVGRALLLQRFKTFIRLNRTFVMS